MTTTLGPGLDTGPDTAPPTPRGNGWAVAALFTATSFFGAGLLFTVQPLVARLLLPSYGGSATVWSTSSLFFQVLLLVGYLYSHVSTRSLGRRRQPWLHLVVLTLPIVSLPLVLPATAAPVDQSPVLWLLRTLTIMIGLPFVVLSTTGPLLQRWYSWSGGPRAEDPYFMFAASNLGSFGGLLAYPFLVEPHLSLTDQRQLFTAGFVAFAVLTASCAVTAIRGEEPESRERLLAHSAPPTRRVLVTWLLLAFLPSCLMLAVTAHLATDVASIPLLWVAPLAIYLATFVGAFARRSRHIPASWPRAAAALALCVGAVSVVTGSMSIWALLVLNLVLLAAVGFVSHARLAATRPSTDHLTTFYLVVAVGGALGGLVNGLVAPLAFDRVLEYPLVIAAVPFLVAGVSTRGRSGFEARYGAVATTVVSLVVLVTAMATSTALVAKGQVPVQVTVLLLVALLGWWLSRRPAVVGTALIGSLLLLPALSDSTVLLRDRTFYGSYVIAETPTARSMVHGTTLHGMQLLDQPDEPTTYYARSGPLGDVMSTADASRLGVVGLGTGTVAAYGEPGQQITFFEIDRAVADTAADPRYFSFLRDSAAAVDVRVGDGRLLLGEVPAQSFDLLILDAFSSDAIPVHLLTHEAFRLYASRVSDGGAVAVHISNRVFDLTPVMASASEELGWEALFKRGQADALAAPSGWVVLTADASLANRLGEQGWRTLSGERSVDWTDDYSSVLDVLK